MGKRRICAIYTDTAILLAAASGLLVESEKELRLCTFFFLGCSKQCDVSLSFLLFLFFFLSFLLFLLLKVSLKYICIGVGVGHFRLRPVRL